jgi:hypothetical protein
LKKTRKNTTVNAVTTSAPTCDESGHRG